MEMLKLILFEPWLLVTDHPEMARAYAAQLDKPLIILFLCILVHYCEEFGNSERLAAAVHVHDFVH